MLPAGEGLKNLGSYVLGDNLRHLAADWERRWGHPLLLAETFVQPSAYRGTVYLAAHWIPLGLTRGYARSNGKYTAKHGERKRMLAYPLQDDARELLQDPLDRPEWSCRAVQVQYEQAELRSLQDMPDELEDPRSVRGLRHPPGAAVALPALAKLAGHSGGRAAERFSKALTQKELRILGYRFRRDPGRCEAPSDTTFQRIMERLEPGELERVVQRWTQPRCKRPAAVAADGKRIRGANRLTPEGTHYETVTLVDHATGIPLASRGYFEEGGEPAAMRALLEELDVRGLVVTLDAGHAGFATEAALADRHGADYLQMIKGNCKATLARLAARDWSRGRRYAQRWTRSHGRWEKRLIEVVDLEPGELAFRHVRQAIRVTRPTRKTEDGR